MQAQTQGISATTRKTTAEARLLEEFGAAERLQGLETGAHGVNKIRKEVEILGLTKDLTAARLAQFNQTLDSMVQRAKQDAETGKLNLEALRNIANMGGIEVTKQMPIIKLLMQMFMEAKKSR